MSVYGMQDDSRPGALGPQSFAGLGHHFEVEEECMSSEAEIVDVLSTEPLPSLSRSIL